MRKIIIAGILCLVCGHCFAESQAFNLDKCLDIIRQAESANGRYLSGDNGRSLGPYQIQRATWDGIWKCKLKWRDYVFKEPVARETAGLIVSKIVRHCKSNHAEAWQKTPYRAVACHYNAGINTSLTPDKWHSKVKNKVYKGL